MRTIFCDTWLSKMHFHIHATITQMPSQKHADPLGYSGAWMVRDRPFFILDNARVSVSR